MVSWCWSHYFENFPFSCIYRASDTTRIRKYDIFHSSNNEAPVLFTFIYFFGINVPLSFLLHFDSSIWRYSNKFKTTRSNFFNLFSPIFDFSIVCLVILKSLILFRWWKLTLERLIYEHNSYKINTSIMNDNKTHLFITIVIQFLN